MIDQHIPMPAAMPDQPPRMPDQPPALHGRRAIFSLGWVSATTGAYRAFIKTREPFAHYLARHQSGDWGSLNGDDCKTNNAQLRQRGRVLSQYTLRDGATQIFLITYLHDPTTLILTPEEY